MLWFDEKSISNCTYILWEFMHTLALFYGLPEVENGGNSQKVSGIFWVHTKKMSTFLLSFPLSLFLLSELQYRVVKSHFLWEKISLYNPEFFLCLIQLLILNSVFMKYFKRIWTISHRRQATDIFWIKENFWVLHCYTLNFLKSWKKIFQSKTILEY